VSPTAGLARDIDGPINRSLALFVRAPDGNVLNIVRHRK
jgi:hypothetical protein